MPVTVFEKHGTLMDVKFEPDSENGFCVCGNDWRNILRGLIWKTSLHELIEDGWVQK